MPILLDKPFSVGDLDPAAGEGYRHCQLTGLQHNGLTMAVNLEFQFGTASGEYYQNWERGLGSPTKSVDVSGPQVAALWSKKPKDGESVGEAMRRITYEYLIDSGAAVGTIVNNPPLPPVEEAAEPSPEEAAPAAEPQGDDSPAAQPAFEAPEAQEPEAPAKSEDAGEAEPAADK